MSYDIELVHEVTDVDIGNQTYNTSPMFEQATGNILRDFNGKRAADIAPQLLKGIRAMTEAPNIYRAMNPDNGWGSYEHALEYLVRFYEACIEYPDSIVRVY